MFRALPCVARRMFRGELYNCVKAARNFPVGFFCGVTPTFWGCPVFVDRARFCKAGPFWQGKPFLFDASGDLLLAKHSTTHAHAVVHGDETCDDGSDAAACDVAGESPGGSVRYRFCFRLQGPRQPSGGAACGRGGRAAVAAPPQAGGAPPRPRQPKASAAPGLRVRFSHCAAACLTLS